ncbi:hypothetical protein, conserved [Trypanosoma brucei brucei TREU927]|uniref:Guanine nucleotide-binding protein subunit beta-like protein n=1 Tax=Trypanosoma brucei brucei (strain 927/4 GUTat10.1) TaxID=185431 RepID=Q584Y5_TRYB2|nr:hypothetical protein, conserved [Trypanosoma brucei brucei TREU927]AAX79937.1 hypothetical protein, conserved [Trypanosoma brucei]AAZ11904.1 hypothetical protein, conserved [Trypanosoma brucei brucei TREU927]
MYKETGATPRAIQINGGIVNCMALSSQRLLWCSQSNGSGPAVMYAWECGEEEPNMHPLVEMGFVPILLSVFQEKVAVIGESSAALFTWSSALSFGHGNDDYGDDDDDDADEVLLLNEEFLCNGVPPGATHVVWSTDGTTIAVCSPCGITLVDCRLRYNLADGVAPTLLLLDCSCWYGEAGAAFAAFGGSILFAISRGNHLVSLHCNEEWWSVEPYLQRDGHIITRAQQVTCFAVGGSEEGHLVVGLSDGTIKLVQQDNLQVFFVLDVTKQIYRDVDIPEHVSLYGGVRVMEVVVGRSIMVVMRTDAVVYYNKNSMELLDSNTLFFGEKTPQISAASRDGSWCALVSGTQELLYLSAVDGILGDGCDDSFDPSSDIMHARFPLPPHLLEPLQLPPQHNQQKVPSTRNTGKLSVARDKKMPTDKPVTFGRPIKSSGYTASVPWSVQQRQKKLRERATRAPKHPSTAVAVPRYKFLPLSNRPLQPMTAANRFLLSSPIHRAVITSAKFTASGSALVTASGDASAFMLKMPVAKNEGDGTALRVHTAPLSSIDANMSLNAPVVVTGSCDGVVAVWRPTKRASPYIVQKVGRDVRAVKFVYTDKFICYATANSVNFCRYCLDDGGGDLDRKRNESKMKPALEFTVPSAQHVVGVDAINHFASNVVVWAASNKSFGVYDLHVGQNINVIEEAHTRPIHSVALLTAGRYASIGSNHLHMCLTAGMDSTVRLWDIRQKRSVRQLAQHRSNATAVGVAFSPTGALVAVGSETRNVFIYDVGSGAVLDKLPVTDTATAICWHPIENVLAIGTSNGGVQLMGQR